MLGDDQIRVDPNTGLVYGLPRPLKKRLLTAIDEISLSPNALRARLDDEYIALEPVQRADGCLLDQGYPVALIVHLNRHQGSGIAVESISKFEATTALLDQVRCYASDFRSDLAVSARIFRGLPHVRISVGDGEVGLAFNEVLRIVAI